MYSFGNKNQQFYQGIHSSVRALKAKVEVYNDQGTLVNTFYKNDYIKSIEIQRIGNNNFFGSVVCQRLSVNLLNNQTTLSSGMYLKPYIGLDSADELLVPFPKFRITEINRDEITKSLSITAYDYINDIDKITIQSIINEINQSLQSETISSYSVLDILSKIAQEIGCAAVSGSYISFYEGADTILDLNIFKGFTLQNPINLEGTENLRDVLQWIAEIALSVIYIKENGQLAIKRIKPTTTSSDTLLKSDYIGFVSKTNRRLVGLARITELGNNIEAKLEQSGTIYYIRNNPFLEMVEDNEVATYLNARLNEVQLLTINQFECEWFSNPALEFGDRILIEDKANNQLSTFIFNDTITYNGSLKEKSEWNYDEEEKEETTPSTIGELISQTYAKVDKANKQITLMVSDVANAQVAAETALENTRLANEAIEGIEDKLDEANNTIEVLKTNYTELDQTARELKISVGTIIDDGVNKIETKTGYTFDDEGLKITRNDSEISTIINEDGMRVKKGDEEVLVANNQGVEARNLHANTYLIIGKYSRFEDYEADDSYTGCFWMGGNN